MATFKGKTEDGGAPFLNASFWKKGVKVSGRVLRPFDSENGKCYELALGDAVKVGEREGVKHASVGGLKGFIMALSAAGLGSLLEGDFLMAECTGETKTDKGAPMINFYVEVIRPEKGD